MRRIAIFCILAVAIAAVLLALNWSTVGPVVGARWARLTGELGTGPATTASLGRPQGPDAGAAAPAEAGVAGPSDEPQPSSTGYRRLSPAESVRRALGMNRDGRLERAPAAGSAEPNVTLAPAGAPIAAELSGTASRAPEGVTATAPREPTEHATASEPAAAEPRAIEETAAAEPVAAATALPATASSPQSAEQALADAPAKVLRKAPSEMLAKTLAEVPERALEKLPPEAVQQIAEALQPLEQSPPRDGTAPELLAVPRLPGDDALAPRQPRVLAEPAAATPTKRRDGSALVLGTGERALPAPVPLDAPGSAGTIAAAALPDAAPLIPLPATGAQPEAAAEPSAAEALARRSRLALVLNAPPEALKAVPRRLLADALATLEPADLDRLSPELTAALPAAIEEARAEVVLDEQAEAFVAELTAERSQPIAATQADHFVGRGQRVTLGPERERRLLRPEELLRDAQADLDTPLRVVRIERALEPLVPEKLVAAHSGDLTKPVTLVEGDVETVVPLHVALERHRLEPRRPYRIVREVEVYTPTTLAELRAGAQLPAHARVEVAPSAALERREALVEELLGLHRPSDPDTLYYIRTVRSTDVQGVWGIIQSGLIDNFAKGMAVRRGEAVDTYRVEIPRDADERLADASSSFLGRLIHRKMAATTIYNIREGRMSRNADLIRPGQQIVIVDFTPGELIDIYRHFVKRKRGQS